jgi:hypothetical protein
VLVSSGINFPVWLKLFGVALSDCGGGLGEANTLALSQFYDDPSAQLSAWSSGTGAAGVVGYLLAMFVLPHLPTWGRLLLGGSIVASYWLTFHVLLEPPWVDKQRKGGATAEPAGAGKPAISSGLTTPMLPEDGQRSSSDANLNANGEKEPAADGRSGQRAAAAASARVSTREKVQMQIRLLRCARACDLAPRQHGIGYRNARLQCGRYVLPLVLVYWAEYASQSGAWTTFALGGPLTSMDARNRAYATHGRTHRLIASVIAFTSSFAPSHTVVAQVPAVQPLLPDRRPHLAFVRQALLPLRPRALGARVAAGDAARALRHSLLSACQIAALLKCGRW